VTRRVRSQDIHFDLIFDSRDPHFYNLLPISQTVSVNRLNSFAVRKFIVYQRIGTTLARLAEEFAVNARRL
jgi:hypothetical protein